MKIYRFASMLVCAGSLACLALGCGDDSGGGTTGTGGSGNSGTGGSGNSGTGGSGNSGTGGSGNSGTGASSTGGDGGSGGATATTLTGDGATVVVPPNAGVDPGTLAVAQDDVGLAALPGGVTARTDIFKFTPHGTSFSTPVTVTLPLTSSPAFGTVVVYKLDDAQDTTWAEDPAAASSAAIDLVDMTVTFELTGFSYVVVTDPLS